MDTLNIVLAILLFVSAIFLIVAVLMQTGKSKGVGAVAGGASETYFGKNKGKSRDKKLALITTIVAIVFVVLAILAFITQEYIAPVDSSSLPSTGATDTSSTADTSTTDSAPTDSSVVDSTTADSVDAE